MTVSNPAAGTEHSLARPLVIIAVAIAVAALLYVLRPIPEKQVIPPTPLQVDAIEVVREPVQLKVTTFGTVPAATETRLSAEVQGRVTEVSSNFVVGGFLTQGETLLAIDDLEYRTALARTEAAVASAVTALAEERGRAEVAYQDWLRRNQNAKRTPEAKDLALRKPQIAEAEANLDAARADLERARENLNRTRVTAPYDGILRSRAVDLGQHVTIGSELGIIFATDSAEVRLPIPEHRISALQLPELAPATGEDAQPPITAELSVERNGDAQYWQAEITRTESVLDDRSRVLYLIATISDPYRLKQAENLEALPLRVGTFVKATVHGRVVDDVARIPHHVLRTDNIVWIIDAEGSMHQRSVEVINTDETYTYLRGGLQTGERIAMGHLNTAVSGTRVSIANLVELPRGRGEPGIDPESKTSPVEKTVQAGTAVAETGNTLSNEGHSTESAAQGIQAR